MTVSRHLPVARRVLLIAMSVALAGALSIPASAAPAERSFGPVIEDYAPYEGQSTCRRKAKRGVRSFRNMLLRTYGPAWMGIGRRCSIGGKSEHKEGRALDWSNRAWNKGERRRVNDLLNWLLASDEHGNLHANARRIGLMYVIWNRQMWSAWNGEWRTYCVQKGKKCRNEDGEARHPHRNHVHFSFGWDGARRLTSFWNPELSQLAPEPEPEPEPEPTPSP